MTENNYVPCPSCNSTIITTDYKSRYGQCSACHAREEFSLGGRVVRALRR